MTKRRFVAWCSVLVLITSAAAAQPFTRRSSQPQHDALKQYYEISNFKLGGRYDLNNPSKWENGGEGGVTLESVSGGKLRTAYIALGTPRRNTVGEITNAVIVNSYYSGDSTDMYEQWVKGTALSGGTPVIGPGRPIDTDRYYVVLVDPLGTWGASKPSDGLGQRFPQYSYFDMVQANYRLLHDHLKVAHAALITGVSMGGTQTYVWGVMHPEFMGALMPIGGTTQSDKGDPVGNWTFQLMTAAIESDPVWRATGGNYYNLPKEQHPLQGVAFGWSVLSLTGFDFGFRSTQDFGAVQPDIFYWEPPNQTASSSVIARAKIFDAVDLVWRNRVGEIYNINDALGRITARTLILHITNDQWLNFKLAQRAAERIPGAQLMSEESPVAHYGVFSIINHKGRDPKFVAFMNDVTRLDEAQKYVAANYRTPAISSDIQPDKSFWKNYVTYPFPVKYATVKDGNGVGWQIGYMDEYAGTDKEPPVLVIIHGKGAFGGHYGNIMKMAVERGLRVIVPDLPCYGMSGPGNLDKCPGRTMQDMRDVVHNLIVDQLGVKRAAYLGHSLGGQLVLGYALSWPQAVQSLILEAPAGLEEYPRDITIAPGKQLALFDPSFGRDFSKWKQTWDQTGVLAAEKARTEQGVRDFFYFKKRDPSTGVVAEIDSGYFLNDSEYARLHTEQRVGMIKGDPAELDQWVNVFIYDIYTMVSELQMDDPKNLYERLAQIKAPIFLAFGDKEPFIPGTAFNGLKDLANDVIVPFMVRMTNAGNRPTLKIYTDTGHFIHTDNPVLFPADVVDFVQTASVDTGSPPAVDRLVHGSGPTIVVFIHGNLASKDWLELSAPLFPRAIRVIGIDWRGCGESDRPAPEPAYANYTMRQHAEDMLAALDALDIPFCHLATHSTGGIISTRMLLAQPRRFGKVLALDPVAPFGIAFNAEQIALFQAMMASRAVTRSVMATAAASLFMPGSLQPGSTPKFRPGPKESLEFFDRIVEQTFRVSEGIWLGTPLNLNLEHEQGELAPHLPGIAHEHLVLWGEADGWIPLPDLRAMAAAMPHCRLICVPNVGHSMNVEQPALYAGYFGAFFGGLKE